MVAPADLGGEAGVEDEVGVGGEGFNVIMNMAAFARCFLCHALVTGLMMGRGRWLLPCGIMGGGRSRFGRDRESMPTTIMAR